MNPKVSIIMSTYNDAKFLPSALRSVLNQSFKDWELLVINDNSFDGTENILKDFKNKDSRIIFWTNPINFGLTKSLNAGLGKARGEYIARIDSDDVWLDTRKLEKQVDFLNNNPDCCVVGTWAEAFGADGQKLFNISYPVTDGEIRKHLLLRNCFVHSSVLARKISIIAAGGYDPNWQYIEDYALWLKVGLKGSLANLPEIMVRYRVNSFGITVTKNKQQIKNILNLIRQYKGNYSSYYPALFKWSLEYILSLVGLTKIIIFLKGF